MIIEQKVWPVASLINAIQDMQPGFARRPNLEDIGVAQLRTNNVSNDGNIDLSEIKYIDAKGTEIEKYSVYKGDVIFNNTNSPELVGRAAYFDLDRQFVLSNHMTRLRVNSSLLDAEFLARYLNYLWQIGVSSRWAKHWVNQAAIDQAGLGKFEIPLPPLPEQRRIVAILRKADELRQLRRQANARAKALLPALFAEMFGDPISNNKKWPISKLSDVGELDRGRSRHRPRDAAFLYGGIYPFIQTGDVTNSNGWIKTYSQTYSEAGLAQSRLWSKGTLCITIAANIARTAILTFDACFPDSVVGFLPGPNVTSEYVQYWLQHLQQRLEAAASQSAQKNINLAILRDLDIPCPPYKLQKQFQKYSSKLQEQSVLEENANVLIDNLFRSTFARAFTGELTAAWREAHKFELAEAAAERDRLLGLAKPTITGDANITLEPLTLMATATSKPSRAVFADLEPFTQILLTAAQAHPAYFRAEELIANQNLGTVQAEAGLQVLAALGFVRQVAVEGQLVYRLVDAIHESAAKPTALQ